MDHEKVAPIDEKAPHGDAHPTVSSQEEYTGDWREQEDFMTRNGLNLKSFQRRPKGGDLVVFDKSMKTRHLHMIAIGGSIGAGFFVGSGAALANGVSCYIWYILGIQALTVDQGSRLALLGFLYHGCDDLQRRLRSW
jgi:amino acid transporter